MGMCVCVCVGEAGHHLPTCSSEASLGPLGQRHGREGCPRRGTSSLLAPCRYCTRAQVDLEQPDPDCLAQLQAAGAVAALDAGDGLFVPSAWWHHVHASAECAASVSLNFWFDTTAAQREAALAIEAAARARTAPPPPSPLAHAAVARELERLAATVCPALPDRARFFASVLAALDGSGAADPLELSRDRQLLGTRNYVRRGLQRLYGADAAPFVRTYLDPRRWSAVQLGSFLDGELPGEAASTSGTPGRKEW